MPRGYRLLISLVAGWLATSPVAASETCMSDAEKDAFELRAAQTEMMIAALQCDEQEPYNLFVRVFNRDLYDAHARLSAYFRRAARGGDGEAALDRFITELANAQSMAGARDPVQFCPHLHVFVRRMVEIYDVREVPRLNAQMHVENPYMATICGTRQRPPEDIPH